MRVYSDADLEWSGNELRLGSKQELARNGFLLRLTIPLAGRRPERQSVRSTGQTGWRPDSIQPGLPW